MPGPSVGVVRGLWFVAVVGAWSALLRTLIDLSFKVPSGGLFLLLASLVLTAVAIGLTRFGRRNGAPRVLWVAIALGSIPAIASAWMVLSDLGFDIRVVTDVGDPALVVAILIIAVGPAIAALVQGHLLGHEAA